MNTSVIIPSFNEAKNVQLLIRKIYVYLPDAKVIVVDDSNHKENEELKKNLKLENKNIMVVSRHKKLGRGSAVINGMKEMLKNRSIKYFFEMDADLAHDPKDFQKFFTSMNSNKAALVIGSRYLSKSRIIKWPMKRLILSKIINFFINIWLGLKLSDYTNGFRLYNLKAVEFLTKIHLKEKGFIALSEIAYKLRANNFKISEVPITFTDRDYGKSNANFKEFIASLIGIVRIKIT